MVYYCGFFSLIVDGCIDTKANVLIKDHLHRPNTLYLVLLAYIIN
jgi:hypothetical protein